MSKPLPRPIQFLFENSIFLVAGALAALLWANFDKKSHDHFFHVQLVDFFHDSAPEKVAESIMKKDADHDDRLSEKEFSQVMHEADLDGNHSLSREEVEQMSKDLLSSHGHADHSDHADASADKSGDHDHHAKLADTHDSDAEGHHEEGEEYEVMTDGDHSSHAHPIDFHFLINDVLMAFFFAIAAKEVWESLLPGGSLSSFKKAATPLLATVGGIVGPLGLYLLGAYFFSGNFTELSNGWAVPCATDIAFSYLVARLIFGAGHPAIAFLLLLAIADDAAGLVILAVAFPQGELQSQWLLLTVGAMLLALIFRKAGVRNFWWYLILPGAMSWYSFYSMNIHAALGLVPIIPFMPTAARDLGFFNPEEQKQTDTLNEFEHWWKNPVELILGLFGLCNAGVVLSSYGAGTTLVLVGLLIGKPLGITLFTLFADKVLGLSVPKGMNYRHIITLGCIAGIGFTVSLFVSTAAFASDSPYLDSIKMGALLSFGAVAVSFFVAFVLGIRRNDFDPDLVEEADSDETDPVT